MAPSVLFLAEAVDGQADHSGFSGVVRVDRAGQTLLCRAYGYADRAHEIPCTTETQLATASGTKTFTALTVMSLVESGTLDLTTTARSLLGGDVMPVPARVDTSFLRSDELPGRAALGYLFRAGSGRTCSTCRCWAAGTAASTRRWPTCSLCGRRSAPAGSYRRNGSPIAARQGAHRATRHLTRASGSACHRGADWTPPRQDLPSDHSELALATTCPDGRAPGVSDGIRPA